MTKLSPARLEVPTLPSLHLKHQGKIRDTYELPDHPYFLLPEVSDGISIFDFVLNVLIPDKGYVLNGLSHFAFRFLEDSGRKTHMVAAGSAIDRFLPEALRGNRDLQKRAMVVHRLAMLQDSASGLGIESIVRYYLTGSAWNEYRSTGSVAGIPLPPGMQEGDALPQPIFNPTTKELEGHDEPLDVARVRGEHPEMAAEFLSGMKEIRDFLRGRGILLADSKSEFGHDYNGILRWGDETATPDCSRFWLLSEWEQIQSRSIRHAPSPHDKQLVRNWGKELGINKRDPRNPADVEWVHSLDVPRELVKQTTATLHSIFERITGKPLETYWREDMGILE